jgi:hypothetical protein
MYIFLDTAYVNRLFRVLNKTNRSSVQESPIYTYNLHLKMERNVGYLAN